MIDLLLKAVDRVVDLARIRDKRLRARYDEIYKPSFAELQQVHADYGRMLCDVVARLRGLAASPSPDTVAMQALRDHVSQQRQLLLPVRQKLKALDALLEPAVAALPPLETEFLRAVARYFDVAGLTHDRHASAASAILDRLELSLSARLQFPDGASRDGRFVPAGLGPMADLVAFCEGIQAHADRHWQDAVARFNALRLAYAQSVS